MQVREIRRTEEEELKKIFGRFLTETTEARGTLEDAARHVYCADGECYLLSFSCIYAS